VNGIKGNQEGRWVVGEQKVHLEEEAGGRCS